MHKEFFSNSIRVWFDDTPEALSIGQAVVTRDIKVRPSLLRPRSRREQRNPRKRRRKIELTDDFIADAERRFEHKARLLHEEINRSLLRAFNDLFADESDDFILFMPTDFIQRLDQEEQNRLEILSENLTRAVDDAHFEFRNDSRLLISMSWALKHCNDQEEHFDDDFLQELVLEAEDLLHFEREEERRYG